MGSAKDKTVNDIGEIMILEQYLRVLSPELQVWIKDHDSQTAAEAASLADVFVAAWCKNSSWAYKFLTTSKGGQKPASTQHHPRSSVTVSKPSAKDYQPSFSGPAKTFSKVVVCY